MHRKLLHAVAASLVLTGCSSGETAEPDATAQVRAQPKTLKETDPEAYHSNVESAMKEIAQSDMQNFQRVFICEMKKNNASPNPKPIDADYIRALAEHVKNNPTAGQHCVA
jgi:uncharacterized protein YcfL